MTNEEDISKLQSQVHALTAKYEALLKDSQGQINAYCETYMNILYM